jgi:putative ferrous iron transport protein C
MLAELKAYLLTHASVSLAEIARHFDISPEMARTLLEHWRRKGKVSQLDVAAQCKSGCGKPCNEQQEVYQWLGRPEDEARSD